MPIFHWDMEQGSSQWFKAHQGVPSASQFHRIMTPKTRKMSEQRKSYACALILQEILNLQPQSLETNENIRAGKENEPKAVADLELIFGIETIPVGFVTTDDGRFGASPDRVVIACPPVSGEEFARVDVVVECKCPTPLVQMDHLLFGDDDAYRCQRQGQLLVAEADKAIFFSYNPRMPPYMVEDGRDELFLRELKVSLEIFWGELQNWKEKAVSLGAYQAFPEFLTPLDAERGNQRMRDALQSEEEFDALIASARMG